MPELPEVEAARRTMEAEGLSRTIETVSVTPDGMTMAVSESTLRSALLGHRLTAARRHGKHLFVRSGEDRGRWLRIHFGMTGELVVDMDAADRHDPEHDRLRLDLEGDRGIVFRCPRKLGEIDLVASPEAFVEEEGLGPDVLSEGFGLKGFRDALDGRRGTLKSALMDQRLLAGIGNEYSDEILFQAGIHPGTRAMALSRDGVGELWRVVRRVLEKAADVRSGGGEVPGSWLLAHREEGEECPRCGGTIQKERIAGRSSYLCPDHQGEG